MTSPQRDALSRVASPGSCRPTEYSGAKRLPKPTTVHKDHIARIATHAIWRFFLSQFIIRLRVRQNWCIPMSRPFPCGNSVDKKGQNDGIASELRECLLQVTVLCGVRRNGLAFAVFDRASFLRNILQTRTFQFYDCTFERSVYQNIPENHVAKTLHWVKPDWIKYGTLKS